MKKLLLLGLLMFSFTAQAQGEEIPDYEHKKWYMDVDTNNGETCIFLQSLVMNLTLGICGESANPFNVAMTRALFNMMHNDMLDEDEKNEDE